MMPTMVLARGAAWRNPANAYLLAGCALIGLTLWLPWLTAARTARVELRADTIAGLLLTAARDLPFPATAGDLDHVLGRLHALAAARGAFVDDLEPRSPTFPEVLLVLTNKHYVFQLAVSPPAATEIPGRDTVPALEVMAWPQSAVGPAHSVYFHPENAPAAYTRNLSNGIVGFDDKRPQPGSAHRRPSTLFDSPTTYRSATDDRWILF